MWTEQYITVGRVRSSFYTVRRSLFFLNLSCVLNFQHNIPFMCRRSMGKYISGLIHVQQPFDEENVSVLSLLRITWKPGAGMGEVSRDEKKKRQRDLRVPELNSELALITIVQKDQLRNLARSRRRAACGRPRGGTLSHTRNEEQALANDWCDGHIMQQTAQDWSPSRCILLFTWHTFCSHSRPSPPHHSSTEFPVHCRM